MPTVGATYEQHLEQLPGVLSYRLVAPPASASGRGIDATLKLRTRAGVRTLLIQLHRSHLSDSLVQHVIVTLGKLSQPVLIVAPLIGVGLAAKLAAAGLNYLDSRGNCHIAVPPLFIHVEGKTAPPSPKASKGVRRAGYQVLFAFLAAPQLLDATLRVVAEEAGVSHQAVSDMRHRLLEEGYVLETKAGARWHPHRRRDALDLWLRGYETTLRAALLWGTYRTRDKDPGQIEKRLIAAAKQPGSKLEYRWGGSAAGFRLTGYYRGERTVVHVPDPGNLNCQLQAIPDPGGNLVLMDAFGTLNWKAQGDTAHPLLVYAEMLAEGSERAREAAQEVFERYVAPNWEETK